MVDHDLLAIRTEVNALKRVASSLVDDAAVADDIVQDAWLASVGAEDQPPEERKVWLRGVVRNLARSYRRDRARRRERELRAARPESVEVDLTQNYDVETIRQLLSEAIDALDEPYATVIRDRFLLAKSTAEVAASSGRTESTIRRQVQRGVQQLRTQLAPH